MWLSNRKPHEILSDILAPFEEMKAKLKSFTDTQRESIGHKQMAISMRQQEIATFNTQIGEHNAAIAKANSIRGRISELLSPATPTKESV